jgi:mediator of RNA polymerase II transcription subunit 10
LSSELKEQIPLDVVEYIENGRNPDVYTREFAELLAKQNQFVNGKMKAMGVRGDCYCVMAAEY